MAAAEVKFSANGRMGVTYDDSAAEKTQMNSRFRVAFSGSLTTDSGISAGGSIRADNAGNGASGTAGSVNISGAFGKITMGDISSALDDAAGNLAGVGYTGLGDHSDFSWSGGGDDEGVSWSYTAGDLGVHASLGQRVAGADEGSVAVTYAMAPFSIGLGVSQDGGVSQSGIGIGAEFAGANIKVGYLSADNAAASAVKSEVGASISGTVGVLKVAAYFRSSETGAGVSSEYVGLGFSQSLGGGATLAGGVVDANGVSKADLGLNFSF